MTDGIRKCKKIGIFEEINENSVRYALGIIKEGNRVYFNSMHQETARRTDMKKALESGLLVPTSKMQIGYEKCTVAWRKVYQNVDEIFNSEYARKASIKNMKELMGTEEISNMFKKKLYDELVRCAESSIIAEELIRTESPDELYLFATQSGLIPIDKKVGYYKLFLDSRIKVFPIKSLYTSTKLALANVVYMFYPWYSLLRKITLFRHNKKKDFKIGAAIDQQAAIFLRKFYGESIIMDDVEIKKDDLIFIDESSSKNFEEYKKRGFNYTSLRNMREKPTFSFIRKLVFNFLPIWFKSFFCLFEERLLVRTASKIMSDYILWNVTMDAYKINNYLRRMVPDSISKIATLRSKGVKTWVYYPDATAIDDIIWHEDEPIDPDFNFMDYDYAVVYGRRAERFFKAHPNSIKNYILNGILYSQLIIDIKEGKLKSNVDNYLSKKEFGENRVIGVFDTTYSNRSPLSTKEGIEFANHILRLLTDFKGISVIFKVKLPWDELSPDLQTVYMKLREHERCLLFPTPEGDRGSSSEVIAKSDFVISAAYTSPTIEALGAGIRGMFYDVGAKKVGDGYYFNKFPNLVAHDYAELKKLMKYWLGMTEKKFKEYLEKYIKDEFDPYLDGKALSRFRTMLKS